MGLTKTQILFAFMGGAATGFILMRAGLANNVETIVRRGLKKSRKLLQKLHAEK